MTRLGRPNFSPKSITVALSLATTLGCGYVLSQASGTETVPTSTGGLAKSQQEEQKILDAIGKAQLQVQQAMTARTAAVMKYANATGGATLLVKSRAVAPVKTHAKTRASGGGKNETEFDRD